MEDYSINGLTLQELQACSHFLDDYRSMPTEDSESVPAAPDDNPGIPEEDLQPEEVLPGPVQIEDDPITAAMRGHHDEFPSVLVGTEYRGKDRWVVALARKVGTGMSVLGDSSVVESPLIAWNRVAATGYEVPGMNGPIGMWRKVAPQWAAIESQANFRNELLGIRCQPGKSGKYKWSIDYRAPWVPGGQHRTVGPFASLGEAVNAWAQTPFGRNAWQS